MISISAVASVTAQRLSIRSGGRRPGRLLLAGIAAAGALCAAPAARADVPPKVSFRATEGGDTLHASIDFRPFKANRMWVLSGPDGAGISGSPTVAASAQRFRAPEWEITPPVGSRVGEEHKWTLTVSNENGMTVKSVTVDVVAAGGAGGAGGAETGLVVYSGRNALEPFGPIEVIYTEIVASSTSIVPGARDGAGMPVVTNWLALEDLAVRYDGGEWAVKGRTTQASTLDSIVVLGNGSADAFMQDGQPFQGGLPGEQYDFFDGAPGPIAWNEDGDIGFSARSKGGAAANAEKVVRVVGGVHTIVLQQGSPLTGLIDNPPGSSGDEQLGNSVGGVHLWNDGTLAYMVTPITNCHSTRYPAFLRGSVGFRQSGIHMIGGEVWDSIDLGDVGGTPDGAHWFAQGDTENADTTVDDILAVDDAVVIRENTMIGASGVVPIDVLFTRMVPDGTWYARGDDAAANDWAVRNGQVIIKTGDPILGAGPENWGNTIGAFNGNHLDEWVAAGNTSSADPNADNVLVFNGEEVVAREGDGVDVDGDGMLDDDAFIAGFQPDDLYLTPEAEIYLLVTLRNGAGTAIGDAYLRIPRAAPCPGDCGSDDGEVDVTDLLALLAQWDGTGSCDIVPPPPVDVSDLLLLLAEWGTCP